MLVALSLWYLSLRFSVAGFSIQMDGMIWAGWVLGLAVTVIELIFTSQNRGRNVTLTFLGVIAYAYGIWSNVVGIYASRELGVDTNNIINTSMLFSVALGLLLEIAPEPLFLWGILGSDTDEGDFISTLTRIWDNVKTTTSQPPNSGESKRPVGRPRKHPFGEDGRIDTVSNQNYIAATRLSVIAALSRDATLVLNKDKSQSPVLMRDGMPPLQVSRALIRTLVAENVLKEKQKSNMITEYILQGSEPPMR
jgi:hypothetical protein